MAATTSQRRFLLPLILLNTVGLAILGRGVWLDRVPLHQLPQVPEPYRSQLIQGIYPANLTTQSLQERNQWMEMRSHIGRPSFSHDGKYLLLPVANRLHLYEAASGKLVRVWLLPSLRQNTALQVFSAYQQSRWYIWSPSNTTSPRVYSVTPEQEGLGEPITGLPSVESVSLSGRYVVGCDLHFSAYGPTTAPRLYLHDRETGKTTVLDFLASNPLTSHDLLFDTTESLLYGRDPKTSEFFFFDLATAKCLPTPIWLTKSGAQYCRLLPDTILTAHHDGTIKVRARNNPETVLRTYPTEIHEFSRVGVTPDRAFLLLGGRKSREATQADAWISQAIDMQGKGRDKVFRLPCPAGPLKGSWTEELAHLYWSGGYLVKRTEITDGRYGRSDITLGDLSSQQSTKLRWNIDAYETTLSPTKELVASVDRRTGDLLIWRSPLARQK